MPRLLHIALASLLVLGLRPAAANEVALVTLDGLALRLTATVMLGACLTMAVIGEWLIVTLFGAVYQPAYPALLALLPGLLGLCYASILRLDLIGKNRPATVSLMALPIIDCPALFTASRSPEIR